MRKKLLTGLLFAVSLAMSLVGNTANVNAAGACNFWINGSSSVPVGQNLTLTVGVTENGTGGLQGVQGVVTAGGVFTIVSGSKIGADYNSTGSTTGKFIVSGMSPIFFGSANLVQIVVKASSVGSGTLSLSGTKGIDGSAVTICNNSPSISLTATTPPSTNANLASLSVSGKSISPSFNAGTTTYSLNVENDVASVTVNATVAEPGATVSGTGARSLNYGNNALSVTVTAPAGNQKVYVINVNRKDNRSSDNSLKSLKPSTGSINFSSNVTTYSMEVPYDVAKVNFTAVANDTKAKVVVNTPDLAPEETRSATIVVTAENGSTRTYTINIRRAKDPNTPKSKENRLEYLKPSAGILSPAFSSDAVNYAIYLPYEISNLTFEYAPIEKKYATVGKTGSDNLEIGENRFTFKVTAEDGSTKEYVVTVHRFDQVGAEANKESPKPKPKDCIKEEKFNIIPYLIGGGAATLLATAGFAVYNIISKRKKGSKVKL